MTVKTVIFVLLFTEFSFIYSIFACVLFRILYPEKRMKRESGEVPNSPAAVSSMFGVSYLCHCLSERMGRRCTGNESEDLQNKVEKLSIRGKWAVRKWF